MNKCKKCDYHKQLGKKHSCNIVPNKVIYGELLEQFKECCDSFKPRKAINPLSKNRTEGYKIYISGGITNCPDYQAKFDAAEKFLTDQGFTAINPTKVKLDTDASWSDYMREDIKQLMECDEIYMLNGWGRSAGARIEHELAQGIGMKINYQSEN